MKALLYLQIMLVAIVLHACIGSNYYLKQGNYDAAINFAVQKIRKNPKKADKHIVALEQAWNIERLNILERIDFLKIDGSPESWVEIHALYAEIDGYQNSIKPYLPLFIKKEFRNADIEIVDVKAELVDAKMKAASFMYAKGEELLAKDSKLKAREAFIHFQKVKEYYGSFKDVDAKIEEAYNKGQNHILLGYSNHSQMIIPQEFMNNLSRINESGLNTTWTKYHLNPADRTSYDYLIEVHVTNVDLGPEQVNNTSYVDEKKVQDGFQYVLDSNGNVAKDSLGNDMKEPAFKNISAKVFRIEQTKVGVLAGVVQYKKGNGTVFQSFPYQESLVFKNFFATYQGDVKALTNDSKKLIGGQPLPFPSNLQMVMDASEIIKNKTYGLIQGNQNLVIQ
jgi:tetratricopeptide (TPR) repeat protein